MSIGHKPEEYGKPKSQVFKALGEGDTPYLYDQPFELDTGYAIPAGGGSSVDGKTVYIDFRVCEDLFSGKIKLPKLLTPEQVIRAWVIHERTEWAINTGDNPYDTYMPCHECAQTHEHEVIAAIVGPDGVDAYEQAIRPSLDACYAREFKNPPKDLWCGPYLDNAGPEEIKILKRLKQLGVIDAAKISKFESHYGMGEDECFRCIHYNHGKFEEIHGPCAKISGNVKNDRYCDYWDHNTKAKDDAQSGSVSKFRP